MSAIFVAAYNCQGLVPLLAFRVLGGSSGLYGVLMSCLGLGAVTGSLLIASRAKSGVAMVAAIRAKRNDRPQTPVMGASRSGISMSLPALPRLSHSKAV